MKARAAFFKHDPSERWENVIEKTYFWEEIAKKHGTCKSDTASADVQIALLTDQINRFGLARSKSHRLKLIEILYIRRRLMKYLESTNTKRYRTLISELGIK